MREQVGEKECAAIAVNMLNQLMATLKEGQSF